MVRLVVAQIWMGPERFFRWIGSKDTDSAEGRGMFVLTVENGAFEHGLKFIDGGLRDVIGDLLGVFGPEVVAEVRDGRLWHRR